MGRTVLGAALLAVAFFVLPGIAADEKKDVDSKKDVDKKDNPYVSAGRLTGTIVSVEGSKRSLRIDIGKKTINPVAMEAYNQARKSFVKARSKEEKIAALQQVQAAQKDLIVTQLELQTIDDVVVRIAQPPAQFDEKGKIKRYTKAELKELKGTNPKLPGYNGDFSSLREKQIVLIELVKKKEAVRARGAKGRDADTELLGDNVPQVRMVVVLREPPG